MSTGTNNFDELQRMLALKRCEHPPRQFFNKFSDSVLHNLDAPERPETMSWLQRIGVHFDVSPAVVGTLAISVCALLAGGIAFAWRASPPTSLQPLDIGSVAVGQPKTSAGPKGQGTSIDPVLAPEGPPIDELRPQLPATRPDPAGAGK